MVDHPGQSMGDFGVQPSTRPREMVADTDTSSTCGICCVEAVGQMYTTQMEEETGQETDAAHQARQQR